MRRLESIARIRGMFNRLAIFNSATERTEVFESRFETRDEYYSKLI